MLMGWCNPMPLQKYMNNNTLYVMGKMHELWHRWHDPNLCAFILHILTQKSRDLRYYDILSSSRIYLSWHQGCLNHHYDHFYLANHLYLI